MRTEDRMPNSDRAQLWLNLQQAAPKPGAAAALVAGVLLVLAATHTAGR